MRHRPEIRVSSPDEGFNTAVVLIVVDSFGSALLRSAQRFTQSGSAGIVLIIGTLEETSITDVASAGVSAVLRRRHVTPDILAKVISGVAQGEGSIPGDLVSQLLKQLEHCHRHDSGTCTDRGSEFTERERQALTCVAAGYSTLEIAREMGYSERTIKVILAGIVGRFNLRNRTQAVAYAIRAGLI
ncbi:response regulator transcription factor [Streptomyces sp. NPDC092307]|uniref:response regulator transcription factor n=1 Tax=Streptomyces sp. NPDC092307 TaxID=3366013 RepID=UPI003807EDA5